MRHHDDSVIFSLVLLREYFEINLPLRLDENNFLNSANSTKVH